MRVTLTHLPLHVLLIMHSDNLLLGSFLSEDSIILFLMDLVEDIVHDKMLL